ncbi:unnamed protein product, partial [Clonostachys byssicola]
MVFVLLHQMPPRAALHWNWPLFSTSRVPTTRLSAGDYITEPGLTSLVIGASIGAIDVNPSTLLEGCTTGNCSFPSLIGDVSLSTTSICSKCIDAARYIRNWRVNETTIVGIPEVANFTDSSTARTNFFSKKQYSIEWARDDFDQYFLCILNAPVDNHTFLAATSPGCEYKNDTSRISKCVPSSATNILFDISGQLNVIANVFAPTCSFYWCMRHHKVEVVQGTLSEMLVAESPGFLTEPSLELYRDVSFWKPTCKVGDEVLGLTRAKTIGYDNESFKVQLKGSGTEQRDILASANCTVMTSSLGRPALQNTLAVLDSSYSYRGSVPVESIRQRWENNFCGPWSLTGLLNGGSMSFASTVSATARACTALTNRMREIMVQRNFLVDEFNLVAEPGGYIHGEVIQTAVCTEFLWRWLLGPALILLVTFAFLMYSVVRSVVRRNLEPLWKNSLLSALYLNPGSESLASEDSNMELKKRADSDIVALTKTSENTWELLKEEDHGDESQRGTEYEMVMDWSEREQ